MARGSGGSGGARHGGERRHEARLYIASGGAPRDESGGGTASPAPCGTRTPGERRLPAGLGSAQLARSGEEVF